MASTALNLPCLSSSSSLSPSLSLSNSHVSATSLAFQIPKKRAQFFCLARKTTLPLHPINPHNLPYPLFAPQLPPVGSRQQTEVADKNLTVAKAAEVAAPTSEEAKSSKKGKGTKYPRRLIDIYQILKKPVITEAAVKTIADGNALVFTVDARADKTMIKEAFTNFFGVKVRKVNTSIRPDGTKKAFIMLSKDVNASDIAKTIGIFPSSD